MKNLIDFQNFKRDDFLKIIDKALLFETGPKVPFFLSEQKSVVNFFLESSTRTRFSFELAEKRLGLQVLNFSSSTSSMNKGESLYDTLKTLDSMKIDACVLRCGEEKEEVLDLAKKLGLSIINAGSGVSAHPSQALLDLYTMKKNLSSIENLKIAFVGDIEHSRVVASHLEMWDILGAEIFLSSSQSLNDSYKEKYSIGTIDDFIDKVDVLYLLRVQTERHKNQTIMTNEQYHEAFGLNEARLKAMKPTSIVMHPGPYIRGKEIASHLVEHEKVKIFDQVASGVPVRMAILDEVFGGLASESLSTL